MSTLIKMSVKREDMNLTPIPENPMMSRQRNMDKINVMGRQVPLTPQKVVVVKQSFRAVETGGSVIPPPSVQSFTLPQVIGDKLLSRLFTSRNQLLMAAQHTGGPQHRLHSQHGSREMAF